MNIYTFKVTKKHLVAAIIAVAVLIAGIILLSYTSRLAALAETSTRLPQLDRRNTENQACNGRQMRGRR